MPAAIGVEFGSRLVKLGSPSHDGDGDEDNTTKDPDEGKVVKLQIWDTAGQVRCVLLCRVLA